MKVLWIVLMTLAAAPVWAQEDALKGLPGYVDFGELGDMFGEPTVQIAVGQSLLNMVGAFSARKDPEVAELFKRLKGVRVNVFEMGGMPDDAVGYIQNVSSRLRENGWESVVTVNSPTEQVRIFMKLNGEMIDGITVMALEEGEAAFINVIGNLNPAEIGKVMDNFNIDINGAGNADVDE